MEIQKKVMKYSALVTGIMFVISILLEWDILKNIKIPYCFSGHNSFILNYIISITASGMLTFIIALVFIALVSYLVEKRKIVVSYSQNYYWLLSQMKIAEIFFVKHGQGKQITIEPIEKMDLFYHLEKINHILNTIIDIGLVFNPVFPLFKRNYEVKNKNSFYATQQRFHSFCIKYSTNIEGIFDYNELLENFIKHCDNTDKDIEYIVSARNNFFKNIFNMTTKSDDYGQIIEEFGRQLERKFPTTDIDKNEK